MQWVCVRARATEDNEICKCWWSLFLLSWFTNGRVYWPQFSPFLAQPLNLNSSQLRTSIYIACRIFARRGKHTHTLFLCTFHIIWGRVRFSRTCGHWVHCAKYNNYALLRSAILRKRRDCASERWHQFMIAGKRVNGGWRVWILSSTWFMRKPYVI